MAKTVDQKIVELQFNNKQFERNTRQSMSTLDKLKSKLNFKGMSKGLDDLSKSSKRCDMSGLASGINTINSKFSAMEVIGISALQKITHQAVFAGERMVSALTIDPVKMGLSEYELKMNSVKTIMAGTGESIEVVNKYLDELNRYSDQTIYSFQDMTQNIGKFTNAGVSLEDAVAAIKGISNEAAVSGANANEASRAMYNFSQALSGGYVKLIDWKSIELANMATKEFKQELIDTAVAMGTLGTNSDGKYFTNEGKILTSTLNFNDSLQDQWMTSEVLIETLKRYTDTTTELGKKATDAATKVRTMSMMFSTLQESAQSGWARTWEFIVGDLHQAEELWTNLTNAVSKILDGMSDWRNAVVGGAMGFRPIDDLVSKLSNSNLVKSLTTVNDKIKDVSKSINKTTRTLEEYQDIVNRVWRGDYQNEPHRSGLLEAAGWNAESVQSLVNLGYQHGLTLDEIIKAEKSAGISVAESVSAQERQNQLLEEQRILLEDLSEEKLRELGLTEEEIKLYKQIQKEAKKAGMSVFDFVSKYSEMDDGRTVLIKGFTHIGTALSGVFGAIKRAWKETMDSFTFFDLYMLIDKFEKFTKKIEDFTSVAENMDKVTNTFKGLFAILKVVTKFIGGGIKIAWVLFSAVVEACGMTVLDFTSAVGLLVSELVDWIDKNDFIFKGLVWLATQLITFAKYVYKAADELIDFTAVMETVKRNIHDFQEKINSWMEGLKNTDNIGKYIIDGIISGLQYGLKKIRTVIRLVAENIIALFEKIFKIHSPSLVMKQEGIYIIQGLYNGIKSAASYVFELIKAIGHKILEIIKDFDLGAAIVTAFGTGALIGLFKIAKFTNIIADGVTAFNNVGYAVANTVEKFGKVLGAIRFKIIAASMKDMAIAVALLAGAIVVLSKLEVKPALIALGMIAGLMVILGGIIALAGHFGKDSKVDFVKLAVVIVALSIGLNIMSKALSRLSGIKNISLTSAMAMIALIGTLLGALYLLTKNDKLTVKAGWTLIAIGLLFSILTKCLKSIAKMETKDIYKSISIFVALEAFTLGFMLLTKIIIGNFFNFDEIGKNILAIVASILLLIRVVKLVKKLSIKEIVKGVGTLTALFGLIAGFLKLSKMILKRGSINYGKISKSLMGISAAIGLLTLSLIVLGKTRISTLAKGAVAISILGGLVVGLIAVCSLLKNTEFKGIGTTVIGIAGAITMMAASVVLLGLIKQENLDKGLRAIGTLTIFIMGIISSLAFAKDAKTSIMALTTLIGLLVLSIGLLSLIKPEKIIGPTIALSLLMGAISLIMFSMKNMKTGKLANKTIMRIMGIILLLAGIVALLSKIDPKKSINTSIAISVLMLSLVHVVNILSKIKMGTKQALSGLAGLLGVIVLAVACAGVLKLMDNVSNAITNAQSLSAFMLALTAVLIATALVGTLYTVTGGLAATGLAGLLGVIILATACVGVLYLMKHIDNAEQHANVLITFMTAMTNLLIKISLFSPLISMGNIALIGLLGIIGVLSIVLTTVGALIDKFPQIEEFIKKGLPILILLANGIGQILGAFVAGTMTQLSNALPDIANNLSLFAVNMIPFITIVSKMDNNLMNGSTMLIKTIIGLSIANFIASITKLLSFGASLPSLGSTLSKFALNILPFINIVSSIPANTAEGVKALSNAVLSLTTANLVSGISRFLGFGKTNIEEFANSLTPLGKGMNGFVKDLGVFSDAQVATVKCAGDAITALAESASKIPKTDGLWQKIFGTGSLTEFAKDMPTVAKGVKDFVKELGSFDEPQIKTAECAAKVIKAIADAADAVPKKEGLWQKLFGSGGLKDFAKEMPTVADGINGFVDKLKGIENKTESANSAAEIIKSMSSLATINIKDFAESLPNFAEAMKNFANSLCDFVNKIDTLETENIDSAVDKSKTLSTAIRNMITEIINTLNNRKPDVQLAFTNIGVDTAKGISDNRVIEELKKQGMNFVTGFAGSIKNNKQIAIDAAKEMGKNALAALAEAEDSHSPSKETYKLGTYFGEGYSIAMRDYSNIIYNDAYSMGDEAKNGLTKAVSKISSFINSGINANPTIKPVLDLSDVDSGLYDMNKKFSNPSLSLMSDLGAINRNMNARSQNGNNASVVTAIDKLRNTINGNSGNTYNINGLNYSNNSEIEHAIQTLVNAAIIERRV